ncbi:hypothetical protein NPIL_153461 [Nephila pilipes]|uniref:Uncharacterized protein n=1 Tax=Nephila pilipes TaxID=299642 RepID=A0A8X6PNJ8_NEPPI|nr:hypothetical protein NPIL_153461 [Nephila pilipes]
MKFSLYSEILLTHEPASILILFLNLVLVNAHAIFIAPVFVQSPNFSIIAHPQVRASEFRRTGQRLLSGECWLNSDMIQRHTTSNASFNVRQLRNVG